MFNSFERHKWLEPSIFKLEEDLKKIDIEFDFRLVGSEYDLGFILEYKYLIRWYPVSSYNEETLYFDFQSIDFFMLLEIPSDGIFQIDYQKIKKEKQSYPGDFISTKDWFDSPRELPYGSLELLMTALRKK